MPNTFFRCASLAVALCSGSYAAAQTGETVSGEMPLLQSASAPLAGGARIDPQFAKFAPRPSGIGTTFDYEIWNEALKYFVLRMGKSLRDGASRPDASLGTRRVYGHDSRYRLEGNRVVFEFMDEGVIDSFSEYRQDLERTADLVDIPALSRNEQLAYWTNLHNVAVIEQVARAYPVSQPSRMTIGDDGLPFDESKFITVSGVRMSLQDIRTKIVFANWSDPKVIYGFFRGDIGGPSIQSEAFTGRNIGEVLTESATEFVNSLRGTQKSGNAIQVSEIYAEARPFFFADWPTSLRAHLRKFAQPEVIAILDKTTEVRADIYEPDIADLAKGMREPSYDFVESDGKLRSFRVSSSMQRLLGERAQKIDRIIRGQNNTGRVTIIDVELPGEASKIEQVE